MTILKTITNFTSSSLSISNNNKYINNNNNRINNSFINNNNISESSGLVHFKLYKGGIWEDVAMEDRVAIYNFC